MHLLSLLSTRINSLLLLTTFCSSSASADTHSDQDLLRRIEQLEKDLATLKAEARSKAKKQPVKEKKVETPTLVTKPETIIEKTPELIPVKKSDFDFKIGGRVKLDSLYDVRAKGPLFGLDPTTIPLRDGFDQSVYNKGHFNFSPAASRLYFDARKTFDQTPTRGYIEIDFAKNLDDTTTSFTPRIRHAYAEIGNFLIGQTWVTFQDMDTFANTLDNLYGGSRQSMVRYTHKFTPCLSLAVAIEKPNNQYITNNGAQGDNSSLGKSQLPDFASQLRWNHQNGHLAFSTLARRLQAKYREAFFTASNFEKSAFGWGLGFSGRYNFHKKSGFYWQVNGGRGIGRYIDDVAYQDFYLEYPTPFAPGVSQRLVPIKAINYILGIEYWWTEKLASTIAASITSIRKPRSTPFIQNYNHNQQRYHVNLIYNILPNSNIGLELMHYRRKGETTTREALGHNTRILASFIYNFNM